MGGEGDGGSWVGCVQLYVFASSFLPIQRRGVLQRDQYQIALQKARRSVSGATLAGVPRALAQPHKRAPGAYHTAPG
jgi:hypothetical protein